MDDKAKLVDLPNESEEIHFANDMYLIARCIALRLPRNNALGLSVWNKFRKTSRNWREPLVL